MHPGGALALATIIIVASAGIVIRRRRAVGWRRIVVAALLVWLGIAGLVVLWALIAAVAGQRAYFGAVQVPRSALTDAMVGITFGAVAMHGVSRAHGDAVRSWPRWFAHHGFAQRSSGVGETRSCHSTLLPRVARPLD